MRQQLKHYVLYITFDVYVSAHGFMSPLLSIASIEPFLSLKKYYSSLDLTSNNCHIVSFLNIYSVFTREE
jgi:hypothetical protein